MKKLLSIVFNIIPGRLIMSSFLRKWIHRKNIPSGIASFCIGGSSLRMYSDNSPIAIMMFWLGKTGYESQEIELWERLSKSATSIVEIGGNIGVYTIFGASANPQASYRVYEPVPYNYGLLKSNLEINNINHVCVFESAVISNPGLSEITLFIPSAESHYNAPTGSFIAGAESIDRESSKNIIVKAVQSKDILNDCDLLKLDTEGAEFEILSGLSEALSVNRTTILVEVRRKTHKLRAWIVDLMASYDFVALAYSKDGVWHEIEADKIPTIVLQEEFGTRDLILVPKSIKSKITEA